MPRQFNYELLHHYGIAEFEGRGVAELWFVKGDQSAHVYILSGRWSNLFLAFFLVASVTSLAATYLIKGIAARFIHSNAPLVQYWSTLGALLTIGEALFCVVLGSQILQNPQRMASMQDQGQVGGWPGR